MAHLKVVLLMVIFVSFCLKWVLCLGAVPERTEVTYVNEKYLYNVSANVVRYGRRSTYYYNLEGGLKLTWGNNVTVHAIFFEVQNNQFKRSFVEIHIKLCDLFRKDQFVGKVLGEVIKKYGKSCPFMPGMYHFTNVTFLIDGAPNLLHFQKGKVEVTVNQLPTGDVIAKSYTIFNVRN